MKKILLTLLISIVSLSAMHAEEITLSYSDVVGQGTSGGGGGFDKTIDPISFSFSNAYGNNSHIKSYGNCEITLSGATITKVVITATSTSYIRTWSANEGEISVSSTTATWEGSSSNLVLTNTATSQARITNIVVTYTVIDDGSPVLTLGTPSDFVTALNGTKTQTLAVTAKNLSSDITVSLTDDSGKFSINTTTLTSEGGNVEVTYNGSSAGVATATLKVTCGDLSSEKELYANTASHAGTQEDPLTVTDVVTLNNTLAGSYWVKGVVANGCISSNGLSSDLVDTNIVLEEDSQYVPVNLPSGDIRTALNIIDNSENIGATVKVYGALGESYYSHPAVKNVIDYELDESSLGIAKPEFSVESGTYYVGDELTVEITAEEGATIYYYIGEEVDYEAATEYTTPISVTENTTIHAWATKDNETSVVTTVTYEFIQKVKYGYVTKVTSGKKYLLVAENEDIKKTMTPLTGNYGYINVEDVTPEDGYIMASDVNAITITETEGGYTLQDSNGKYLYQKGTYNNFNVTTNMPAEGAVWTIELNNDGTGSMTITNTSVNKWIQYSPNYTSFGSYDTLQESALLPRLYEEGATAMEDPLTGVEDTMVDANAPVEYYNLQGVKVARPENGIFIRKQGGKATKVVL